MKGNGSKLITETSQHASVAVVTSSTLLATWTLRTRLAPRRLVKPRPGEGLKLISVQPLMGFEDGILGKQSAKPLCELARTQGGRANRLTAILTSLFRDRNYLLACLNPRSITSSQQLCSPWRTFTKLPDYSLGRVNMTSDNWRLQNLLISMMYRSVHRRTDPGGNLELPFPGRYLLTKAGPKTLAKE